MKQKKIIAWDTLRIFFLLSVILYHTQNCFNSPWQGCPFFAFIYQNAGYFCNYYFFILSGILTAKINREKIINGNSSFLQFFKKRYLRVYPVHFIGEILAIYLIVHEAKSIVGISISHLIKDALFLTSGYFWNDSLPYNGPAWFICILILCEILFYAISYITKKSDNLYISISLGFVLLGGILEKIDCNIPFLYRINGEGYMNFFFGVSLYAIYRIILTSGFKKKENIIFSIFLITELALLTVFGKNTPLLLGDKLIIISILCAILIGFAALICPIRKFLELKPLCLLNNISLELYLLHMPLLSFYFDLKNKLPLPEMRDGSYLILYVLFTIIVCLVIHYSIILIKSYCFKLFNKKNP